MSQLMIPKANYKNNHKYLTSDTMTRSGIFNRHNSLHRILSFLIIILAHNYCFANMFLNNSYSSAHLVLALQFDSKTSTTTLTPTTEQYLVTNFTSTLSIPTAIATGKSVTSSTLNNSNNSTISSVPTGPKTLKFTLTAGKFWKFNIKADSVSSLNNGELRLHRNLSKNNYITDDDNWFQYNPEQQQFYSWPSLSVRPGTYHFVLLPSGVDSEEDSENIVSLVVADIVVELIRPVYQGVSKSDIDILVDHKFSLEYLKRHSSFSLLLNQLISIFDTLKNNTSQQEPSFKTGALTTAPTPILNQNSKLANKLRNIVLIEFTYSSNGEFSFTWSTHPSIVNNTLTPILECRVNTINDTVSRFSNLSSGSRVHDEKFVVYYPINIPLITSQANVFTTREKLALKLTLNGPCQKNKIVENFIIKESNSPSDKENGIINDQALPSPTPSYQTSSNSTSPPVLPYPEAVDSAAAVPLNAVTVSSQLQSITAQKTQDSTVLSITTNASAVTTPSTSSSFQPITQLNSESKTTETALSQPSSQQEDLSVLETRVFKSEVPVQSSIPKVQPQAKSFAEFFDSNDAIISNNTMSSTTTVPIVTTNSSQVSPTTTMDYNVSIVSTGPTKDENIRSESSLNEDFIGVLNDVMEYLVSVAVPVSVIVGTILLVSLIIAVMSLCRKKRKSKQFEVKNRFNFRYGSERKAFLKNSSKPVILDADQKSISFGGTPQHRLNNINKKLSNSERNDNLNPNTTYLSMHLYSFSGNSSGEGTYAGGERMITSNGCDINNRSREGNDIYDGVTN